ncbi:L-threonylcarbamoyladenylate synthase [soil metagenome]
MIISVKKAAELIRNGEVVGIPTETVYGLAADAENAMAIRKTFELKGRPADNPLIVHIPSSEFISKFSDFWSDDVHRLTETFWPGPLTIILPKKNSVLDSITAGLDSVALRSPDHEDTLSLLRQCGPVTAPSANRSGRPSPTRPQHVLDDFGDDFPVVDGGECKIGIESTVLDLTSERPMILRPGKISAEELSDVISREVVSDPIPKSQARKSPGTQYTHYKPSAVVMWMAGASEISRDNDSLYIFHTGSNFSSAPNVIDFKGDYDALAKSLYDLYRTADRKNWDRIYIQPLPADSDHSIIPALKNRIERSADG